MNNGKTVSIGDFYIKRFFRIIPAFLFVLALYLYFPGTRERGPMAPAWRYLTFTQNYGLDISKYGSFSHAWSLCIEEQFYFCLPLFLIFLQYTRLFKNSYWILIALSITGLAVRIYNYNHFISPLQGVDDSWGLTWFKWIYYPTYCRLDGLLAGISIAALFEFKPTFRSRISKYGNHLLLLGIVILVVAYFICYDQTSFSASIYGFPLVALGYGLIVAGAVCPSCFLFRYRSSVTTRIAVLSYSIYLVHKMVIHLVQGLYGALGLPQDGNLVLAICIVAVFLAALLMNKIIEKPALNLRKKVLQRIADRAANAHI